MLNSLYHADLANYADFFETLRFVKEIRIIKGKS